MAQQMAQTRVSSVDPTKQDTKKPVSYCPCMHAWSLQLYPARDARDCSPPGSSVHGISPGRILEWVAISFLTQSPELAGGFFTTEPPGKSVS